MKESYSKLDSTQKMVVKLFQQLVTEYTDRLHSLIPTGCRLQVSLPSSTQPAVSRVFNTQKKVKKVVKLLQQLVTECPDRVPATQPCTVASTTGYRVYRPGTGYTALVQLTRPPNWLQSHPTQSIQLCVDSGAGRQQVSTNMASTDWLQIWSSNHQTKSPDQFTGYTALFSPKPVAE